MNTRTDQRGKNVLAVIYNVDTIYNSYTMACPPLRGNNPRDIATVWGFIFICFAASTILKSQLNKVCFV